MFKPMTKTEFFNLHGSRLIKSENSTECDGFLFLYPEENENVAQLISEGHEAYPINDVPSIDGDDSNDFVDVNSKNDLGYSPFKYGYLVLEKEY